MFSEIHLMFIDASSISHVELEQTLLLRLHKTEQKRYETFTNQQRRQTWLVGRALLLAALERQLGQIDVESIRTDELGGVRLQGKAIYSSMSHSRNMFVVSLSCIKTGVDIEWLRPRALFQHVEQVFTRTESDQMHDLIEAERRDAFYAFWTLKEAACKVAGLSLWDSLQNACFDLRNGGFNSHAPFPSGDWHFLSAYIEPGWRVAVAMRCAKNAPKIEGWRLTASKKWRRQLLARQIFLHGN